MFPSPLNSPHRTQPERSRPVPPKQDPRSPNARAQNSRPQSPRHGQRPDIRIVKVADPFEPGAKLAVAKNVREHPLETLLASGRITQAQAAAGDVFRKNWERAAVGAMGGVDPAKIRVDGGGTPRGTLSDGAVEAVHWLNMVGIKIHAKISFRLLAAICGDGRGIAETANKLRLDGNKYVVAGRAGDGYVLGRLLEALDDLSEILGMVAIGRK